MNVTVNKKLCEYDDGNSREINFGDKIVFGTVLVNSVAALSRLSDLQFHNR